MILATSKKALHALQDPSRRLRLLLLIVLLLVAAKAMTIGMFFMLSPANGIDGFLSQEVAAQTEAPEQIEPDASAAGSFTDNQSSQWEVKENFSWSYDLILALQKRDEELRVREYALKKDAERIELLKKELDDRISALSGLEGRIKDLVEQKRTVENEKMQKLAKVFEETPPEQAGPLISRLDVDIAAQLILRMNNRKAGRMWGFVEPEQAVKISEELARLNPGFKMIASDQ